MTADHQQDTEADSMANEKRTSPPASSLMARLVFAAGLAAGLAFPALAQDGKGAVPENATARGNGAAWDCDPGYRVDGAKCSGIEIPDNAYPTGLSYGRGWACRRGHEEIAGTSCAVIPVPPNAFLRSSGHDWQCARGFRRDGDSCVDIVLPQHAYLTEDWSGSAWACERGFTAEADRCVPIAVPENGYLTDADYGDAWACERGFVAIDGRCDPVAVPDNAFLDQKTYGPGWRCERGYETLDDACVRIDLPENAHLDERGNRWSCNRGFRPEDGACVLAR
jgi:hypothetical protein